MWKLIIETESDLYIGTRIIYCSTPEAAYEQKRLERELSHKDERMIGSVILYRIEQAVQG